MNEQMKRIVIEAYVDGLDAATALTSQDICDNLRDTATLTVDEVTEYMLNRGSALRRDDDRLVWQLE